MNLSLCYIAAIAYTGTIKLKQSWLDQFEDSNSAESKILTGNIEQAVSATFKCYLLIIKQNIPLTFLFIITWCW